MKAIKKYSLHTITHTHTHTFFHNIKPSTGACEEEERGRTHRCVGGIKKIHFPSFLKKNKQVPNNKIISLYGTLEEF